MKRKIKSHWNYHQKMSLSRKYFQNKIGFWDYIFQSAQRRVNIENLKYPLDNEKSFRIPCHQLWMPSLSACKNIHWLFKPNLYPHCQLLESQPIHTQMISQQNKMCGLKNKNCKVYPKILGLFCWELKNLKSWVEMLWSDFLYSSPTTQTKKALCKQPFYSKQEENRRRAS